MRPGAKRTMNALPTVVVLIIGHADQRGDEVSNDALSAARAEAVADYPVARGVAPSRMSSRAVGEADLLTLDDDGAALTLNRRTEFVLYGLPVWWFNPGCGRASPGASVFRRRRGGSRARSAAVQIVLRIVLRRACSDRWRC
jgi:hypothetical protein